MSDERAGRSQEWEELPDAPPLVPRGKTAQITLRLPASSLVRIKGVAAARSVPYHPLTRSWLMAGLRDPAAPEFENADEPHDEQLNIKLDQDALDEIKARADELGRPYHRLAREFVEVGLSREEERLARRGAEASAGLGRKGVSPYATGGGGVTLERRIAARYFALMLTGHGSPELGDARAVISIAFQQAPAVAVDDLVVLAKRPDEVVPSLHLAIGVRRAPNFVPSHTETQKLVADYLRALLEAPEDGIEHRFALVVAGNRQHAQQVAELAAHASKQMDAASFSAFIHSGKVKKELRERLEFLTQMIENALRALDTDDPDAELVEQRTWEVLARLSVLMPRVEDPETSDWFATQNSLLGIARGRDLVGASALLDRLEVLAGQFAPAAATVDLTLLRRQVHVLLERKTGRSEKGWRALEHLHSQALRVRNRLGIGEAARQLHLDRGAQAQEVLAQAVGAPALLVHGESGVGKSALVIGALTGAAAESDEFDVLCLDLRQLPESTLELISTLDANLKTLLSELTAPHRFLVIDGADAATETRQEMFGYLLAAARQASVTVVAVAANESRQVVLDAIEQQLEVQIPQLVVRGLTDDELSEIALAFAELARLTKNARSRELLRRLVIVDLLVRSKLSGLPLSDVEAMREVWAGLVRNRERADRGSPEAREQVLLRLAKRELAGEPARELALSLDAEAVDGLRHDGVLKAATGNAWEVVPEFAHDELRRYAVARALLIDRDPAGELMSVGAPRWALSSATLACQALLAACSDSDSPRETRLDGVQMAFDAVVAQNYGARWADVPAEALLGLADPTPILTDAWPKLREGEGLSRLLRLVGQRHRSEGIIDPVVAEPIIALLLDEEAPWRESKDVARCLRDWLAALVVADAPAEHPLRIRLRERIVAACSAADARVLVEAEAAARARAQRTPEEIRRERQAAEKNKALFAEIGYGRPERRRRPDVPRELTNDTVLELLALLGRDLGEDGERLLRRVAHDAPQHLAPAVEELFTGRALATYGHGLLAELVEAYYIDDEGVGGGFHEDGVRDHHWRGPITPMAAYYRGPFFALLQSDLRRGVAVINRLLNHAALARARTLAGLGDRWGRGSEEAVASYAAELSVTGEARRYIGDEHVWIWYRGTGVGPSPCMSALQACELFCEQLIAAKIPPERIVTVLLDGCENLAMVGLIVGLLVRHLESADTAIDPFLAEPFVWGYEIRRHVSESSGFAARQEGAVNPERRAWTFREVAAWLIINADEERVAQLRQIGEQMVLRAERLEGEFKARLEGTGEDIQPNADRGVSYTTTVRNWASALDRDRYRVYTEDGQTYFGNTPPEDVEEALQPSNEDLARGHQAIRLVNRYFIEPKKTTAPVPLSKEELEADLQIARQLVEDPPATSPFGVYDAAALVAAAALELNLLHEMSLPDDSLAFAAETLLQVAEQAAPSDQFEYGGSFFEQGADRTAARALPLLLLPQAERIRDAVSGQARVMRAAYCLARAIPTETRLHLARGLDVLWRTSCADSPCHHDLALKLVVESVRDCVMGDWDQMGQRRTVVLLDGPLPKSLEDIKDDDLLVERLDPAIRALGVASVSEICAQEHARELLSAVLDAHRRGLMAHDENFDERGSHAMVAVRSLLALAGVGDDQPLLAHIETYADNGKLLATTLRAIAGVAEETPAAAATARRLWPQVMQTVLDLHARGHDPLNDRYYGDLALASLAPMPTNEVEFLYREVESTPIAWTDPLAWRDAIEGWLTIAAGQPHCVDSVIALIGGLPAADQAATGLSWVRALVLDHVTQVVGRSFMLQRWLIDTRPATEQAGTLNDWQELVDALVVAGATDLAPYSE